VNTIDGALGNDKITGSGGSDVIILGDSTNGNNHDTITDFVSAADDVKSLQTILGWNSTDGTTTVLLATGASIKAADVAGDSNIQTISTNIVTHTYATFAAGVSTYAELEGAAIVAMGLTGAMDGAAVALVAVDDGRSTGLWQFISGDAGTDDAVVASEIELIGILEGVSSAAALIVGDFVFS